MSKLLRIGIIYKSKIIQEKIIYKKKSISIGSSSSNTFVFSSLDLPDKIPVFLCKKNKYFLTFNEQIQGKIAIKDKILDLKALKEQNLAPKKGKYYQLPLSDTNKGKISFNDLTIIFQFISDIPKPIKPQLPAAAKGGWVKSIDLVFSAILMLSFLFHTGALSFLSAQPIPEKISLDNSYNRFVNLIIPDRKVKKNIPKTNPNKNKIKDSVIKKEVIKKTKIKNNKKTALNNKKDKKNSAKKNSLESKAAKVARIKTQLSKKGLLGILTSYGPGAKNGDALYDVLSSGGLDVDLDSAMNNIKGGGFAIAESVGIKNRLSKHNGKIISINGLKTAAVGPINIGKKNLANISASIEAEVPENDNNPSDKRISNAFKKRLKGLKSCYERVLKVKPNLQGKINISITILQSGKVESVEILQNTMAEDKVESCIISKIRRWRFPVLKKEELTVSFPIIFSKA